MKMPKSIILASMALLLAGGPVMGSEVASENQTEQLQGEVSETKLYVNGQNVRIVSGAKNTLEVYNVTGVCVATFHIDSEDKTVSLSLPKGIYILKVGKIARKVSLR